MEINLFASSQSSSRDGRLVRTFGWNDENNEKCEDWGKMKLTNSMKELAPKSNRWSLVNLGNVTGNNRKRVARISKIFNSVKLQNPNKKMIY